MKEKLLRFGRVLLGGRPMKKIEYALTNEKGQHVFQFEDTLGRPWLACSSWSISRVPIQATLNELDELRDLFEETFGPQK